MDSAGLVPPGAMLDTLRATCPRLSNSDLIRWLRADALSEGADYHTVHRGQSLYRLYFPRASAKIRRLYHYDIERGFSAGLYKGCADLKHHRSFLLIGRESSPGVVPENPLHSVALTALKRLSEDSAGMFVVRDAAWTFSGPTGLVATCDCVDETDLQVSLAALQRAVEEQHASAVFGWWSLGMRYERTREEDGRHMRAYVLMTAAGVAPNEELFEGLMAVPGVTAAALVYGDVDMVVTVEAKDMAELTSVVLDSLRTLPGVTGTRTYIAAPGYEYTRNP